MVTKLPGFGEGSTTIHGEAVADATPADGGPFPLVVLSHGFSGNPEWYRTIAEHLASHGFVVVAPEHLESDWLSDVVPASLSRPADVSVAIDYARRAGFLNSLLATPRTTRAPRCSRTRTSRLVSSGTA